MDRTRLERLGALANAKAEAALAPVKRANEEVQRLERRIADIADHRKRLMRAANTPDLAGPLLDQANRLRVLQGASLADLARARVALDAVRRQAAQAVGRRHAAEALLTKVQADAALQARRKLLRGE